MRHGFSLQSSLFMAALCVATPALAADPTGDWQVEGGFANIRVAECSGSMWGVVAWEKTPGSKDKNNTDPAKRGRPTLGMATMFDMKKKPGTDEWEGQVYDAQTTGRMWDAKLISKGPSQLRIEGCALGFLCSGQDWTRVGPPIPSSPANSAAKATARPAVAGAAPKSATRSAAPGQTADIGDICLLPEIRSAIGAPAR
jgi:uncharacterized protein (DUF2147 family)